MRQLFLFLGLVLLAAGAGSLVLAGQDRPLPPPPLPGGVPGPGGLQPPGGVPGPGGVQPPGFDPPPRLGGVPFQPGRPTVRLADQFKDLIPALIQALKDADGEVRQSAASALVGLGRDALKPLLEAAGDKDKELRANATYLLGYFSDDTKDVLPVLLKALKEDDKEIRRRAAFALQRLVHNANDAAVIGGFAPGVPGIGAPDGAIAGPAGVGGVPAEVFMGRPRAARLRAPDPGLMLPGGSKPRDLPK